MTANVPDDDDLPRTSSRFAVVLGLEPATILVHLSSDRFYHVVVGADALDRLGAESAEVVRVGPVLLVHDRGLPKDLVGRADRSLRSAGFEPALVGIDASEEAKSLGTVEMLVKRLTELKFDRRSAVVALGGGIVGDVAGFAAAIYRRGVPVVQCPTTLLAMVDAAVGGKTGVNLAVGGSLKKNFVGAFHQPALVVADISALKTLPARVFAAGLAECVKHSMLEASVEPAPPPLPTTRGAKFTPDLAAWMEANLAKIAERDPGTLETLIARNIAIKASVVVQDEREEADDATGGRALLNLGHTFGHAIETLPGLSPDGDPAHAPLNHGEAVALGLVAATNCSIRLGLVPKATLDRLIRTLQGAGLPAKVAGLPPSGEILAAMMHDKKVLDNRLRLVLPFGEAGNQAKVVADPPQEAVLAGIEAIRA